MRPGTWADDEANGLTATDTSHGSNSLLLSRCLRDIGADNGSISYSKDHVQTIIYWVDIDMCVYNTCPKPNECPRDQHNPGWHVVLLRECPSIAVEHTEHNIDGQRDNQRLSSWSAVSPRPQ